MKNPDEQPALRALVPLLDEALLSLREKDRTALLLRFFESLPLREVGASLGVGEDAAQKRVAGALERLAEFFQRRGFKTATVAATTATLQHTAASAPMAVVTSVTQMAMQTVPPALLGLTILSRLAALASVQKALLCAALLALALAWHWNTVLKGKKDGQAQTAFGPAISPQVVRTTTRLRDPNEEIAPKLETLNQPTSDSVQPEKEYSVHLRGIIGTPDFQAALLLIQHHSLDRAGPAAFEHRILNRGEAFDGLSIKGAPRVRFELLEVDPERGRVKLRERALDLVQGDSGGLTIKMGASGEERVYELEDETAGRLPREAISPICFPNITFDDFVDAYGALIDRTVLCHPTIKRQSLISFWPKTPVFERGVRR